MPEFTKDDVGKTVVDPVGDEIGIVETVRDGTAYVDAEPGLLERLEIRLGREFDPDANDQALEGDLVDEITDDEIILIQDPR